MGVGVADELSAEVGKEPNVLRRWARWTAAHAALTVALYFATNWAWHYVTACGGLPPDDSRLWPLRLAHMAFVLGVFSVVGDRLERKPTSWSLKVGVPLVILAILFATNAAARSVLSATCSR